MEQVKDKICGFIVYLFMLSFFGFIVTAVTGYKYSWISMISFIMFLPAVNMWFWQWAEAKKSNIFANKILAFSVSISMIAVFYVINIGSLGRIPQILAVIFVIAYFGWIAFGAIMCFYETWQKLLVVLCIVLIASFLFLLQKNTIVIQVNKISDVVYADIFKELTPPINKKDFIRKYGVPEDIHVEIETEDDGEYKTETFEYLIKGETIYIAFDDEDYDDGYLLYEPEHLEAERFFKDRTHVKENPFMSYRIYIKDISGNVFEVAINKDSIVYSILYYVD